MSSEDKTFVIFIGLLAAVAIAAIAGISADSLYETRALKDMVQAGNDPIAARCALGNAQRMYSPACVAAASHGKGGGK
jgi:hypothetical protein